MWNLVVMSISRLLVFQWVLIVPHWWQICSYILKKLIVHKDRMDLHPLKYHICKIKCTIILYLYGLYHPQHKFSNYTELCFPIKWEGTEIDFYVYSPPIVQILINVIICMYYLYIYVQIRNKISIYLSKFKKQKHHLISLFTI